MNERAQGGRGPGEVLDDLSLLLAVLPSPLKSLLEAQPDLERLVEVVMDLGRPPEARFFERALLFEELEVSRQDLEQVAGRVGAFTADNRAGIERTLHRISAVRNRRGEIIGFTCRVGRAVTGTVEIIRDVIETGESLLLLGPPGVGKTTLLREAARVLADDLVRRVVVVDTSNEIAGDGDVPHPGIGRARRLQVDSPELQHRVMIEAVENHMPQVVVIDEIGTLEEALAARTIAERGVQLIATAHGLNLDNLVLNPTLSDLVGGIQAVTLSDEEARRRRTQKTVLERKAPPTFDNLVEIQHRERLAVYRDIASVVDRHLAGLPVHPQLRVRGPGGEVRVCDPLPLQRWLPSQGGFEAASPVRANLVRIYPVGVSRSRLGRAIQDLRLPARVAERPQQADLILALKSEPRRATRRLREALERGIELGRIERNTSEDIQRFLLRHFERGEERATPDPAARALGEAEDAVVRAQRGGRPIELSPQNPFLRRRQHELVRSHGLCSKSRGKGTGRRVVVYPE